MPKTIIQGRLSHKLRSTYHLYHTIAGVFLRRCLGRPLDPAWPIVFEIGTLFWRRQFNYAMRLQNIEEAREYMDSFYSVLDNVDDVTIQPSSATEPLGDWFIPSSSTSSATMLYLHGGGYSFYMEVTRHFIALLAQTLGIRIFAPRYRLTPEHPHPAQLEDALQSYRFLLSRAVPPTQLIVAGESAGGHLCLMLLDAIKRQSLPMPALIMPLSAWTDTASRGKSLFENDHYDMVQGYMTELFSIWLKGDTQLSNAEVSPFGRDFHDTAPIYMQAGGREILVDMIRDFANQAAEQGARIRLDVWPHMTHEFHSYGKHHPDSHAALQEIEKAIAWALAGAKTGQFAKNAHSEVDRL